MDSNQLKKIQSAAAIGSPTAMGLLAQIEKEAKEAELQKQALAAEKAETVANQRVARIAEINYRIDEAIEAYESFRVLAQTALNKAFAASSELPFGVLPNHPFDFLSKVHLPTAHPRPMDNLYATFSTTEEYIQGVLAKGAHSAK